MKQTDFNMKTNVLILILTICLSSTVFGQRGVRIAYIDMEYILENVEEYREASEQLENKVQRWKIEVEQKKSDVDQMREDLLAEKVLLTDELIEEREEEIDILEKEMLQYQQDRFGPQGDLVLQKRQLIQPIQDQVFNEVQKIGANRKYDFIFDKSADVVMLYSEKRHDISELVLREIGRTRKISAPKKKEIQRSKLEEFEGETVAPISEELQERQDRAAEAAETRAKSAEDKRAEQLRLREERKKAYEERRKKLLEEREARKKAKEEERMKLTEKAKDTID